MVLRMGEVDVNPDQVPAPGRPVDPNGTGDTFCGLFRAYPRRRPTPVARYAAVAAVLRCIPYVAAVPIPRPPQITEALHVYGGV